MHADGRAGGDLRPELLELITSSWISQAVCVAAELRIADHLAAGPRTAEDLAMATDTHAPSLRRLLQALGAIGVCSERDDGRFEITELGSLLGTEAAGSLRHWAMWWGRHLWPVWGELRHSVRTGESARTLVQGTDGFEHLARDPAAAAVFHRALRELTRMTASHVVAACDFSGFRRIVDVGSGHGELLAAILAVAPSAHGVAYDLPHARDGAERVIAESGLAGRCAFVAGDFFESVPGGADAYVLKSVLHDWDDRDAARILASCRRGMPDGARLLVVEQMLPARRGRTPAGRSVSRSDLTMLVAHGARERTESEYRALLGSGGFDVAGVAAAGPTFSVIEATPRT